MPADAGTNIVAAFAAVGTVFSVSLAIISFFQSRGKKEGIDDTTVVGHTTKLLEHDAAIAALRKSDSELQTAIEVLKDVSKRAEADGARQNDKLDRLLAGQAKIEGRMEARTL